MQIPSLENVQVDNLPDECREPWDLMIRQWSQKLERNLWVKGQKVCPESRIFTD